MKHLSTFLQGLFPIVLSLVVLVGAGQIIQSSRNLTQVNLLLSDMSASSEEVSVLQLAELKAEFLQRVDLYEELGRDSHLLEGMAVNRRLDGGLIDECDSLLFSSLRYVALSKIGSRDSAAQAWGSIRQNQRLGKWYRHPHCKRSTSRDMILGLLLSLSQKPQEGAGVIMDFYNFLDHNQGFFGDGPPSVSFLTPGLGESFRRMSVAYRVFDLPISVSTGFSTIEFDALFVERGYQAHLIALQIWLEMEIEENFAGSSAVLGTRSVMWELGNLLEPLTHENAYQQRRLWISQQLFELDPKNLFFKFLRLRTSGHMDARMKVKMLTELLEMSQFPRNRLPQNCDRRADYLWQRDSIEFLGAKDCSMVFNAIDFLWLGAIILASSS